MPFLTRRSFLSTLSTPAMLTAPALLSTPTFAKMGGPTEEQNAGWTRFSLGEFEITIISDGNLVTPTTTFGANAEPGAVESFLLDRHLDAGQNYAHTNHVLVDTGGAKLLVDVGSGDKFQSSAGKLMDNLEAAEIDASDITHVALTHAHPDHVWGMMDDFGDEPRIPEAEYAIAATEFDWWMKEGRVDEVPDGLKPFVVGARNALSPVAERTTMLTDGQIVTPGVIAMATPGHTKGHMSFLIESAGESMLVVGDALNHGHISFEHPEWHFGFDMDKEEAVATRRRLLDMAASDGLAVTGYHLPFPGVGHVMRTPDAYRFVPELWRWSG